MPTRTVLSTQDWSLRLAELNRSLSQISNSLSSLASLERAADSPISGLTWPIDVRARDLMSWYSGGAYEGDAYTALSSIRTLTAPLPNSTLSITGTHAPNYQYVIEPGRPPSYQCSHIRIADASRAQVVADVGTPFSEARTAATYEDFVRVITPSGYIIPSEDPATTTWEQGNEVRSLYSSGLGLEFEYICNYIRNNSFANQAAGWEVTPDWTFPGAGAVGGTAAPPTTTSTNLHQMPGNMNGTLIGGEWYLVKVVVSAVGAGSFAVGLTNATPTTNIGPTINVAGTYYFCLQAPSTGAWVRIEPAAFRGTIDTIYLLPIYNEHVINGTFDDDFGAGASCPGWDPDFNLVGGNIWTFGAGTNQAIAALATNATLAQTLIDTRIAGAPTSGCSTIPIQADVSYTLRYTFTLTAGQLLPRLKSSTTNDWYNGTAQTAIGPGPTTVTETLHGAGSAINILLFNGAGFVGTVSDVSLHCNPPFGTFHASATLARSRVPF